MNNLINKRLIELQEIIMQRKSVLQKCIYDMNQSNSFDMLPLDDDWESWHRSVFSRLLTVLQEPLTGTKNSLEAKHVDAFIHDLNLHSVALQRVISHCWHHSHFDPVGYRAARIDRFVPTATQPYRPEPSEIFPKLRAIIARIQAEYAARLVDVASGTDTILRQMRHEMAVELVREGICRNLGNAQPVIKAIFRKERKYLAPVLHSLLKRGLFDRLPHTRYIRPDFAVIFRAVIEVLSQETNTDCCIAVLLTKQPCIKMS